MAKISYPAEMREIAKSKGRGLVTVDVRGPGRNAGGGTIQTPAMTPKQLDWFLAFCIHLLSAGKSPAEAWELTYGSKNYVDVISSNPRPNDEGNG